MAVLETGMSDKSTFLCCYNQKDAESLGKSLQARGFEAERAENLDMVLPLG